MVSTTERRTRRRSKPAAPGAPQPPCALCRAKVAWVDYKDLPMLRRYMNDRGKIRARRATGNCAQHQHAIAMAIKTARQLVLLPYASGPENNSAKSVRAADGATTDVTGGIR